jgi:hypothetical protein
VFVYISRRRRGQASLYLSLSILVYISRRRCPSSVKFRSRSLCIHLAGDADKALYKRAIRALKARGVDLSTPGPLPAPGNLSLTSQTAHGSERHARDRCVGAAAEEVKVVVGWPFKAKKRGQLSLVKGEVLVLVTTGKAAKSVPAGPLHTQTETHTHTYTIHIHRHPRTPNHLSPSPLVARLVVRTLRQTQGQERSVPSQLRAAVWDLYPAARGPVPLRLQGDLSHVSNRTRI